MGNETSNTRYATDDVHSSNTNRRNTSNASISNTPGTIEWNFGNIVLAAGAAAAAVYLLSGSTENTPERETKARFQLETSDRSQSGGRSLTPYEGKKQSFGKFKCSKCNRYWESFFSYADTWQKCKVCRCKVYPYRQEPLNSCERLGIGIDTRKMHPQDLCGKCQELGFKCSSVRHYE